MASSHNQTVGRMSPRQKMINLMYIVLTAMLALNVSSDVLNGFSQVEDGLSRSNRTITQRNQLLFAQLEAFNEKNPEKGKKWLDLARQVRTNTDQLYDYIDSLKTQIVSIADGEFSDVKAMKNLDNLDAAAQVMLPPTGKAGEELRTKVDAYRDYATSFLTDPIKRDNIISALSTKPYNNTVAADGITTKSWEECMFDNMPVVAAVTLLSKLQNDIRYAEGEILNTLITNVDLGDIRVNAVSAFVVPESRIVMRGSTYRANIVVAAVDTTQRPTVFVNGTRLGNDRGIYEVGTGKSGNVDYKGYIEIPAGDGTMTHLDFSSSYTVIDPVATISATMMNVLYAGIDNPISIAVPGIPSNSISATMTNGSLIRSGDTWIARPATVGTDATVNVTATTNGKSQSVGSTTFRVRKLPDPMPYIAYGKDERYKGGKPFAKATLIDSPGIGAAIDDGVLNVAFTVLSFETVFFDQMGNAIPEVSNGAHFSERQQAQFRRLARGKRFYVSRVKAKGPDGVERILAPIEVIIQ